MRVLFLFIAALLCQAAYGQLLRVDFDDNAPVTETGFSSFAEGDKPSKVFGAYTVTITGEQASLVGGFFDRTLPPDSGAMTYGELYRDFVFNNIGGTLSVTIVGVTPDTPYIITWYLFDSHADPGVVSNRLQPRGGSNTTGSTVDVAYTSGSAVTNNSQFSWSGSWQATDSSLEIDLIDLAGGHTRICGFEMSLGDATPPALLNLSPADDATDVARAESLVITFDENVAKGSGNIVIKRAIDDSVVESIDVNSASVTVAGPVVTILPAFLPASTDCYVQIDAGAIEDASGNAYGGIADTSTWNFSVSDDFLRIDFDDNAPVTETGFESFAEGDKPSKSFGSIGITVTGEDGAVGGFFDRGGPADAGAMTYGELYRDFVLHNSSGTLSFDITGLAPNTPYELTWYMFDSAAVGSLANRIQPRGGSDTIGDSVDVAYVSGSPIVANSDFAYTGVWQSTDGSLEIDVIDQAGGETEVRVCGLRIRSGPPDTTPPNVLALSPADDALDQMRSEPLVITFSEGVQKGSGNIVIKRSSNDSVIESIDVSSAAVTVSSAVVTIVPSLLPAGTDCYVQIDAGAIEDVNGNAYGGIADRSSWNFSVSDDLLRIDFDDDVPETETAFFSFAQADKPSKSFNGIGVTVTGEQAAVVGGFFNRGGPGDAGAMTYGELYRDFVFHNASGTLSFDITGLTPNVEYEITWYMFDSAAVGNLANRVQPRGGSNTTGDSVDVAYTSGSPILSNTDFAYTGTWKSSDGSLEIDVIDQAGGNTEARVCGLRIVEVPAPGTVIRIR